VIVNNFIPVRKRLFVGLLGVSFLDAVVLLAGIWFLAVNPTRTIFDQALLLILAGLLIAGVDIAAFGIGGIVLTILYYRTSMLFTDRCALR